MRGLTSTLVLLAALAGVVGYLYFVDAGRPAGDAEVKEKAFTGISGESIEDVRIAMAGGDDSLLRRTGDGWELVEPVQAAADAGELSAIASALAAVDIQRVVDENPSDLAAFGLAPARLDVAFRLKDSEQWQHLLLGDKTPTGSDLYAKLPDAPRVFLVGAFLDTTFNKDAFALRDKRLLTFERVEVDRVEMVQGARTLAFAKTGSDWNVTKPIAARGDFVAIDGALEQLTSARMQGIVSSENGDLARFGLDRPSATVSVGQGTTTATLAFGRTENGLVFARDTARPLVFTVLPSLLTDLLKDVSDYRRKDLFDSRSFTLDRITFTRGAETFVLERTKGTGDADVWRRDGKDLETATVDDLLARLAALQAVSFETAVAPALATPTLTVTASFAEGKTETVTLARTESGVVARRADETGSARLDTGPFDEVLTALDALK